MAKLLLLNVRIDVKILNNHNCFPLGQINLYKSNIQRVGGEPSFVIMHLCAAVPSR